MSPAAPRIVPHAARTWQNWHETVKQKVKERVSLWNPEPTRPTIASYNATTGALQGLIGRALDEGWRVRAAGGNWSFSPVAATDGLCINTLPMNYRFWLTDADVDASWHGRAEHLVFAQCGMSISQLNSALERRGRSLRTSGASNGQTLAGAIATGTHGSAIRHGAIHDGVRALHIVTAPDRHVWLERASEPLASAGFVQSLGAERVADDALFDAALVSLGSFGIVHGIVLESARKFWLQAYRSQYAAEEVPAIGAAMTSLDFSDLRTPQGVPPGTEPYFFQVIVNPFDPARPFVTLMYAHDSDPGGPRPSRDDKWRPGDGAAEAIALLTDLNGGTPPRLANFLVDVALPDVKGDTGTWGEQFWDTATRGRSAGLAFGIPIARARDGLDALVALNREFRVPAVFATRFVQPSRATLAFTRHAPVTCVLEADGPRSKGMERFYEAAPDALRSAGIPFTLHWGKLHTPGPALTREMYGDAAIAAWLDARHTLLPRPELRAAFANEFLALSGLDG